MIRFQSFKHSANKLWTGLIFEMTKKMASKIKNAFYTDVSIKSLHNIRSQANIPSLIEGI